MRESTEVLDALLKFYDRLSAGDVGSFEDLVSSEDATLVIGTAPGEFVRERERLRFGFEAEGLSLDPGEAPVGYEEGSMGWAIDEPTMNFPDGTSIKTRLTAIMRKEDSSWKLLHGHYSVGVPDEEVGDLQKRWSG
ncbi:MAG: nuclear transport factor 2 family protein [Actinomycetota bacterium]